MGGQFRKGGGVGVLTTELSMIDGKKLLTHTGEKAAKSILQ